MPTYKLMYLLVALLSAMILSPTSAGAQRSSIGVLVGVDLASRTVRPENKEASVKEALSEATQLTVRPSFGVDYERRITSLFLFNVQLRYQRAGFEYDYAQAGLDPITSEPYVGPIREATFDYQYLALPIGITETWGSGDWTYYAQEFIIPKYTLGATTTPTYAPDFVTANNPPAELDVERVQDLQVSVRLSIGVERALNDILRLRLGVSGYYNLTRPQENQGVSDHLYGFGPELALLRVFGDAVRADDAYY